ncbi:hypothetical protein H0H87_010595, partial [Tephrocybe sp. NHM501043]
NLRTPSAGTASRGKARSSKAGIVMISARRVSRQASSNIRVSEQDIGVCGGKMISKFWSALNRELSLAIASKK